MKTKKCLSTVLAIFLGCTFFVGCDTPTNDSASSSNEGEKIVSIGGTVGRENLSYAAVKGKNLVKYGQSEYEIVIPAAATSVEQLAATELCDFIEKSTDCSLPIITDEGLTHSASNTYISVGNTKLLQGTNIDTSYETLGETGVTVTRVGESVFLAGATNYGTLYSVYRFLKMTIGFEAYSNEVVSWEDKHVIPLYDFAYSYVPTVKGGGTYSMKDYWGSEYALDCARMYSYADGWAGGNTLECSLFDKYWCHTVASILPEEDRKEGWMNNGQLCYTNEDMTAKFIENMIEIVDNSVSPYIMIGGYDNKTSCDCGACTADYAKYKVGGVYVRFLNEVGNAIAEHLEEKGSDRKVSIMGLAYNAYIEPPVKLENGEWKPIDETCIAEPNVSIMYTPVYGCFTHALNDETCETNIPMYQQFKG